MFSKRNNRFGSTKRTVSDDWIAALPRDKAHLFDVVVRSWESSYAMASVSLNEAFSLRSRGELVGARLQVAVSADLLARAAVVLVEACQSISNRGRHISNVPQVLPLNTEFFKGQTAQSAASWNEFLHRVLFADRSRFFQKLRILSETLESLGGEFYAEADDLSGARSVHPSDSWKALEGHHYDFNTCLRESEVLLKCFLRALPTEQLEAFGAELDVVPSPEKMKKIRMAGPRLNPQHRHSPATA
ncbi:MAG TPA: hypothetical protein VGD60_15435 [Candidatus Acidoferrales bacterium]